MDDTRHLVEVAGAVLEPDDVVDLRHRHRRRFGEPRVATVVDDDGKVGHTGDGAGVVDQAGLGHLDEVRGKQEQPVGAHLLGRGREPLGLCHRSARAGVDGHAAGDHVDRGADDGAELLVVEGVEFAGAAGDEHAARPGCDPVGDVVGQGVDVDVAGLGERGDGEEQHTVE